MAPGIDQLRGRWNNAWTRHFFDPIDGPSTISNICWRLPHIADITKAVDGLEAKYADVLGMSKPKPTHDLLRAAMSLTGQLPPEVLIAAGLFAEAYTNPGGTMAYLTRYSTPPSSLRNILPWLPVLKHFIAYVITDPAKPSLPVLHWFSPPQNALRILDLLFSGQQSQSTAIALGPAVIPPTPAHLAPQPTPPVQQVDHTDTDAAVAFRPKWDSNRQNFSVTDGNGAVTVNYDFDQSRKPPTAQFEILTDFERGHWPATLQLQVGSGASGKRKRWNAACKKLNERFDGEFTFTREGRHYRWACHPKAIVAPPA